MIQSDFFALLSGTTTSSWRRRKSAVYSSYISRILLKLPQHCLIDPGTGAEQSKNWETDLVPTTGIGPKYERTISMQF